MKTMAPQLSLLLRMGQRRSNVRLLVKFILILAFFFVLFSVLFHMLMLYEGRRYSWVTGFYWTLTTMSTLGFGDITFTSDAGKIFSVVVLLSGIVFLLIMLPFTFIQFFYAPWLEAQNKARAPRSVPEDMSDHVIFTFFDDVTVNLIEKLEQYGRDYVIVTGELQNALDLHDLGYHAVFGDLDDPRTYERIRIGDAALVVVLNDDMVSTNIIYTIREISPKVRIVTNADMDESLDILKLAGSNYVFQFTKMLGRSLARRILGVRMKANIVGRFDELRIAEAPVMRTWMQGKTLAETRLREKAGVTVVGVWDQGKFEIPTADTVMNDSTVLLLAGTGDHLDQFDALMGFSGEDSAKIAPVLVLGGGRVGQAVALSLDARGIDYRVVEKNTAIAARNERFIKGSAGDLETLTRAGIEETPAIIITTHDDNVNIYLTIYCRRLRPDAQIICRASLDRNVNTLHRAGANLVMSFSARVNSTIMNLLEPQQMLMLSEGLNVFRVPVPPRLAGRQLKSARIREDTGCSVVAVKYKEDLTVNPDPEMVLDATAELLIIGTARSEKTFMEKFPVSEVKV
jgi:Trk K+ transport system NAD-binding subunit